MARPRPSTRVWAPPLLAAGLIVLRMALPERPMDATGPRAVADAAFAIALTILILWCARGVGRLAMRRLGAAEVDPLLGLAFSLAGGLGILAYGVLFLGLLGLLRPVAVFAWLGVAFAVAWRETVVHGGEWADPLQPFRGLPPGLKAGLGAAITIFALSLVEALSPVWDYDALMYHLQAPRLFLEAGRLLLLPDLWQANGPLTTEMLYLVGLAAGSEVFSKVIHLAMAGILLVATFAVTRRHLGDRAAWMAGGILLGVPILPVWGSLAYADMGWALFEFLAIAAYLEWRASPRRSWLITSGAMLGLAMGSKYTALALFPILVLAVLLDSHAGRGGQRLRCALWLGASGLVVASPWYLKNLIWAGNPFYPFIAGGPDWSPDRLKILMVYMRSFGTGHRLVDYLLLPFNLFTQRAAFGTFFSRIDIPSPLFLLALAFPFVRRDHPFRPLGWMVLLRFVFWAAGTQQTRFLLPLYPVLSLLAASVLEAWIAHPAAPRWRQTTVKGILGGMVGVTLAYQLIYWVDSRAYSPVLGLESKAAWLRTGIYDFATLEYIGHSLPDGTLVYAAWDGQGYYCNGRCLSDAEQSQWVQLAQKEGSVDAIAAALRDRGVTHVLLDLEGLSFMLRHDPTGAHDRAASVFLEDFAPACLEEIRHDEKVVLYALSCN